MEIEVEQRKELIWDQVKLQRSDGGGWREARVNESWGLEIGARPVLVLAA